MVAWRTSVIPRTLRLSPCRGLDPPMLDARLEGMPWWEELFHPSMWNWGDVATWVTGIFTAGPLLLALHTLRRDQKREVTRQAKSIAIFEDWELDHETSDATIEISIWNYSDRPIFHLSFLWFYTTWESPVGIGEILEGPGEIVEKVLQPGMGATVTHILGSDSSFGFRGLIFQDIERETWVVNVAEDELWTYDKFVKWLRKEGRKRRKSRPHPSEMD